MNCAHMFKDKMARLFTIEFFMPRGKKVKQPICPLLKEWKAVVYSYNRILSAIRSNKQNLHILTFDTSQKIWVKESVANIYT